MMKNFFKESEFTKNDAKALSVHSSYANTIDVCNLKSEIIL